MFQFHTFLKRRLLAIILVTVTLLATASGVRLVRAQSNATVASTQTDAELIAEGYNVLCHEGSASALTWTLFLLAQHPDVQADVLDELEEELYKGEFRNEEQKKKCEDRIKMLGEEKKMLGERWDSTGVLGLRFHQIRSVLSCDQSKCTYVISYQYAHTLFLAGKSPIVPVWRRDDDKN